MEGVGNGIVPTETPSSSLTYITTPSTADIEALALHPNGTLLAAADSAGRINVLKVADWAAKSEATASLVAQLAPAVIASWGWCGARFLGDKIVAAHWGGRYVALFDDGRLVNTIPMVGRPAAMCISSANLVLVAEGNTLSAWDMRAPQVPVKRVRV